jgi:trehalose-6-phosphate synthase
MANKILVNDGVTVEIIGLDGFLSDMAALPKAVEVVTEKSAHELVNAWKFALGESGGVVTGAYLNAIEAKQFVRGNPQSAYDFVISTDSDKSVTYSGFHNSGVPSRNYEGRREVEHAISALEAFDFVNQTFNSEISKALKHGK